MKTKAIVTLLVVGAACFAFGLMIRGRYHAAPGGGSSTTQPAARTSLHYAMNVVVSAVPFWIETKNTWGRIQAANPGSQMSFGGPLNTDAQSQIEQVEALIAQKVDGIIIAPADSKALVATINRAVDAGIPVVTYLVDAPGSKRTTYIASDQAADGARIAEYVLKRIGNRGKVAISYAQAGNAEQEARLRGVKAALAKHPDVQLVQTIEDKYDEAVGSEMLKPVLAQHKDLSAIIGLNSRSAPGAVLALRETGFKVGQVVVTGWDFDNDLIGLIGQDWVQASIAQRSEFMTLLAYDILQGKPLLEPTGMASPRTAFPEFITVPTDLITASNSRAYLRP